MYLTNTLNAIADCPSHFLEKLLYQWQCKSMAKRLVIRK